MFHAGDLQSGIALALQTSKSVICFVCDDSPESDRWENEWLTDERISLALRDSAVALRIVKGSTEAGFLAAFASIPSVPAIIIIRNGRLAAVLTSPITRDLFTAEVLGALRTIDSSSHEDATSNNATTTAAEPQPACTPAGIESTVDSASTTQDTQDSSDQSINDANDYSHNPDYNELSTSSTTAATRPSAQQAWAEQQRQHLAEARARQARILAQIEANKQEQRSRKLQVGSNPKPPSTSNAVAAMGNKRTEPQEAKAARIQVRLLSGTTVSSKFAPTATPAADLRPWIDEALAASAPSNSPPPYVLKYVPGPPEPARTIGEADEQESLMSLGLLPSATLAVVPIKGGADAYPNGGSGLIGVVTAVPRAVFGLVTGVIGGAWGLITNYNAGEEGGDSSSQAVRETVTNNEQNVQQQAPSDRRENSRMRTMAQMRAEQDGMPRELYNGNRLNFQSDDFSGED